MRVRDLVNSNIIASVYTEVASNSIPYLGEGLFPRKKKASVDLSWIKRSKGLPVALNPSAFNTVSTIRAKGKFAMSATQMAFFKESMTINEKDRQDIISITDSNSPLLADIVRNIYEDTTGLIEGADVIPEIMRMQLLAPIDGSPKISLKGDKATYEYNYDPDGTYKTNNFKKLTLTDMWSDVENSKPLDDIQTIKSNASSKGTSIKRMIISPKTMSYLRQNAQVKAAILVLNPAATVILTDAIVKSTIKTLYDIDILVYEKMYKEVEGTTKAFYPDGMATFLPDGTLGDTYYGTTPDEADKMEDASADVTMVKTGVTMRVIHHTNPNQTETLVAEVVLPSFERMDEVFVLNAYTE